MGWNIFILLEQNMKLFMFGCFEFLSWMGFTCTTLLKIFNEILGVWGFLGFFCKLVHFGSHAEKQYTIDWKRVLNSHTSIISKSLFCAIGFTSHHGFLLEGYKLSTSSYIFVKLTRLTQSLWCNLGRFF